MENKYFNQALEFISATDLNTLPCGKHVIDEGNLWVNIVETELRPAEKAPLEAHNEFIDIQIPLTGKESYGIRDRKECQKPKGEFDPKNDIIFYDDPIAEIVAKEPGQMVVFAPDTAHAPLIGEGTIRKAIFKVRAK